MSAEIISLQDRFEQRLADAEHRVQIRERDYQKLLHLFAMAFAQVPEDSRTPIILSWEERPVS